MEKDKVVSPLSIYLLIDKKNVERDEIFQSFYKDLCRNVAKPLVDGMGIPVFLVSNDSDSIPTIDFSISDKNIIFFFIDKFVYLGDTPWRKYIEEIKREKGYGTNIKLFTVKQYKYATDLSFINKDQMILLPTDSIIVNKENLLTKVYDILIRYLKDMLPKDGNAIPKLKIFISHAKADGKNYAEAIRDFLRGSTKLASFYDANDIMDGYDFESQITKNLSDNTMMLVLDTDEYGSRQWCQKEVLWAKEKEIPIVVINMHNDVVYRSFPYLGNVPSIVCKANDWNSSINLLLRTTLDMTYKKQCLQAYRQDDQDGDTYTLGTQPELFHCLTIASKAKQIFYPEPPISVEEKKLLEKSGKKFYTPLEKIGINLENKNIALSTSFPEEKVINKIVFNDVIVEITRYLLNAGGKILYGGTGSQDGFTDLFRQISEQYGKCQELNKGKEMDESTAFFTNYFAWPFYNYLTDDDYALLKHCHVAVRKIFPKEIPNELFNKTYSNQEEHYKEYISLSLSEMRKQRNEHTDALVLVGGRTTNFLGSMPGILEEYILARDEKKPIFLLGGFGGQTKLIAESLNGGIEVPQIKNDRWETLNNGLNPEENLILATSTNVIYILRLILKGLGQCLR